MRASSFASLLAAGAFVAACSATGGSQFTSSSGTGGTGGAGSTGTGMGGDINLGGGFTGTGGGSSGDGCSEAAKLVYVLSTDNAIWSFAPAKKEFTFLFSLNCATPNDGNTWSPNSMAIDRNAVAWVNYVGSDFLGGDTAGKIFRVDISKKTCDPTAAVNLPASWYRLGMGFSTDTAGGTSEALYVTGTGTPGFNDSPGLGKIDLAAKTVVPVGPFTGSTLQGQSAELTGTGDAKLFGFFTTTPVHVAQIDKASGATPASGDHALSQVQTPSAWAFSFWGGAFYLYTSDGFSNSTVNKYDPATNAVDTAYIPSSQTSMIIVGAGVSTCAPLTPPK